MKFNIFKKKKIMHLKTYGDEVLKKTSVPVNNIDEKILDLAKAMKYTMNKAEGVGLAAPQVGYSLRLVILGVPNLTRKEMVAISPGELLLLPEMPLALVNPEITVISNNITEAEEGCLSVPELYAKVKRPDRLMLSAQRLDGSRINVECGGFLSRVILHEIDHLNGVLFVEKLEEAEYSRIKHDLKKIARLKNKRKREHNLL